MLRVSGHRAFRVNSKRKILKTGVAELSSQLPQQAEVVVIGGGIAGCNILYQLSKRGINAVLLEKNKITSGTTWHTGGLLFRLARSSDIDVRLLTSTMRIYKSLEKETGVNPGLTINGALFIARNEERIEEYKRLQTFAHYCDVETRMVTPLETAKLSPLVNTKNIKGALYSPGDGHIDPTSLCSSLVKGATEKGAKVFENCNVTGIMTEPVLNIRKIKGVETPLGVIKTSCIVNSTGVWGRTISQKAGYDLPITAMKHSYVITQSIPEAKGTPNIRDHDGSIYIKIQGDTLHLGGYETNPEILEATPDDDGFHLFELDKSTFGAHLENAKQILPVFETVGIAKDICGPETFTPDHKPIVGEDPRILGLFHNLGYNSGGIMLSGGCSEQLAIWITTGRPEIQMYNYDIRRFSLLQRYDRAWINETSHEAYATNYKIIFPNEQKLAGRNHKTDVFHEAMVSNGGVMEQANGWERPGYFVKDRTVPVQPYDWFGTKSVPENSDKRYKTELEGDQTFGFSKYHHAIGDEALSIRNSVGLFNLSHFTKMYLTGPDAQQAADWLFTVDTDSGTGGVSYSCLLNDKGGIEADCTVTQLTEGVGTLVGPIMKGKGYYVVACGESGPQALSHIRRELIRKNFKTVVTNTTDRLGLLSLQGPKSRQLLQSITESPITDDRFPIGMSHLIKIDDHVCRAVRISFVGELGYQLHIPVASCLPVYNKLIVAGSGFDLRHIGFRAFHSLQCEKGYHLWNHDIRIDDNPVEADLRGICRENGQYLGKQHVDKLKKQGCFKRRAIFTLQNDVCLHGMETIWRDDKIVGYLRRGNYGYSLDCSIGIGYVHHPQGEIVSDEFLKNGEYEIEVMGKRYPASLFLKSPFDPTHNRMLGQYDSDAQEQDHFED